MTFDQLIVQQRPCIERLVHGVARRYYLASSDIEDFRAAVDRSLRRMQNTPDLEPVRDEAQLEQMTPSEAAEWRSLWRDLAALRTLARKAN